jgi:hypothetical protein
MSMTPVELQEKFIDEVLRCVRVDWDRIEVHYEYYVWKGNVLQQFTAQSFQGTAATDIDLSFAAANLMQEMRDSKPEGQAEHWTSMDFKLDGTGKFKFDYGYGLPPMAARTISLQPGQG